MLMPTENNIRVIDCEHDTAKINEDPKKQQQEAY